MKMLQEIGLFTMRKLRETRRNPIFLAMGIVVPILYLAFFSPLLKGMHVGDANVLNTFVPGMLVLIAFFNGLFAGFGIIDELRSGIIERFRVTPASRFAILMGPVLRDTIATVIQVTFFILIALPFGFSPDIRGILLLYPLLILLVTITSSFGNAIGLVVKSEDKLAPIVQGINMPILLLSGMLLPLSLGPAWLRTVAHFNPVYYIVEAARRLVQGEIANMAVAEAYAVTLLLAVIVVTWATRVVQKTTS